MKTIKKNIWKQIFHSLLLFFSKTALAYGILTSSHTNGFHLLKTISKGEKISVLIYSEKGFFSDLQKENITKFVNFCLSKWISIFNTMGLQLKDDIFEIIFNDTPFSNNLSLKNTNSFGILFETEDPYILARSFAMVSEQVLSLKPEILLKLDRYIFNDQDEDFLKNHYILKLCFTLIHEIGHLWGLSDTYIDIDMTKQPSQFLQEISLPLKNTLPLQPIINLYSGGQILTYQKPQNFFFDFFKNYKFEDEIKGLARIFEILGEKESETFKKILNDERKVFYHSHFLNGAIAYNSHYISKHYGFPWRLTDIEKQLEKGSIAMNCHDISLPFYTDDYLNMNLKLEFKKLSSGQKGILGQLATSSPISQEQQMHKFKVSFNPQKVSPDILRVLDYRKLNEGNAIEKLELVAFDEEGFHWLAFFDFVASSSNPRFSNIIETRVHTKSLICSPAFERLLK